MKDQTRSDNQALVINGITFAEVIVRAASSTPSISIGAQGNITANPALRRLVGESRRVKFFEAGGFKHIALKPVEEGENAEHCVPIDRSGKLGRAALTERIAAAGVPMPADCALALDEASGFWYGQVIARPVAPRPPEAARKPRKNGINAIMAERG